MKLILDDGRELNVTLSEEEIKKLCKKKDTSWFPEDGEKAWYKNPDNFPILLIRKKVWKMFAMPNFDIRMINEQGWRLAKKAERDSLYVKEDND